jgi:hypothetical protein
MDLLIEPKTLYAVTDTGGWEATLADFCYQRVIAWGSGFISDHQLIPGAIYPWVVDGRGILSPCKDVIAVIDELPPECVDFECSDGAIEDNFNTLYQEWRSGISTNSGR